MSERDPEVQVLLDKQEIYEVLCTYTRGLDRLDRDLLESVYHPGAIHEHASVFKGSATDFIETAVNTLSKIGPTNHYMHNLLIDVEGDVAHTELYGVAFQRIEKDGEPYDCLVGARAMDRFERRDGTWKIAHRRTILDWNHDAPASETWSLGVLGPPPGPADLGTKTKDDPSYTKA